MFDAGSVFGSLAGLPHFPMSFTSISADLGPKIIEGSLEVKLPTIWKDEKQSREEAERRGRLEERRVEIKMYKAHHCRTTFGS